LEQDCKDNYIDFQPVDVILTKKYRNVFSSAEGQSVLGHMLTDLRCFDECCSGDEHILKNYASRLLSIIGGGGVTVATANVLIRHLCAQPLVEINSELSEV